MPRLTQLAWQSNLAFNPLVAFYVSIWDETKKQGGKRQDRDAVHVKTGVL